GLRIYPVDISSENAASKTAPPLVLKRSEDPSIRFRDSMRHPRLVELCGRSNPRQADQIRSSSRISEWALDRRHGTIRSSWLVTTFGRHDIMMAEAARSVSWQIDQ